jgi:hypothetical protein
MVTALLSGKSTTLWQSTAADTDIPHGKAIPGANPVFIVMRLKGDLIYRRYSIIFVKLKSGNGYI